MVDRILVVKNEPPPPSTALDKICKLAETLNTLVSHLRTQIQALQTEQGKLSSLLEHLTIGGIIADDEELIEMVNSLA